MGDGMNIPIDIRAPELEQAMLHLRRALECMDKAGEVSAAAYAQMALDTLDRQRPWDGTVEGLSALDWRTAR